MTTDTLRKISALAAAAVALAGLGAFAAAEAQAAPGSCDQWGFSGPTNIRLSTGPLLSFAAGESASISGEFATDGRQDDGKIDGDVAPNGFIGLTYKSDTFPNDPPLVLRGDVTPEGGAGGTFNAKNNGTWTLATPLKCLTAAPQGPKEGPSIALDPGIGKLTINVTDHSGTASNCQYNSDFVNRSFKLPANGTVPLTVVPAVPLFTDHQVDITCDNGAETHQPVFF